MQNLMTSGMVVILENGFDSSMNFMQAIRVANIQNNLQGWWWSSDKGLIKDPSESNEMIVKAQTMYDAMMGKPIVINGVRMFQSHSPSQIRQLLDVQQHNLLELGEPPAKKTEQPPKAETTKFPNIRVGGQTVEEVFSFDNKLHHSTTIEGVTKEYTGQPKSQLPPRDLPPASLRTSSDNYDPNVGLPERPKKVNGPGLVHDNFLDDPRGSPMKPSLGGFIVLLVILVVLAALFCGK